MDGMHVLTRAGGDIKDAAHNSSLADLSRLPGNGSGNAIQDIGKR